MEPWDKELDAIGQKLTDTVADAFRLAALRLDKSKTYGDAVLGVHEALEAFAGVPATLVVCSTRGAPPPGVLAALDQVHAKTKQKLREEGQ